MNQKWVKTIWTCYNIKQIYIILFALLLYILSVCVLGADGFLVNLWMAPFYSERTFLWSSELGRAFLSISVWLAVEFLKFTGSDRRPHSRGIYFSPESRWEKTCRRERIFTRSKFLVYVWNMRTCRMRFHDVDVNFRIRRVSVHWTITKTCNWNVVVETYMLYYILDTLFTLFAIKLLRKNTSWLCITL